jgi:23S rRNA (uracil1939-C5)-methyltransferase
MVESLCWTIHLSHQHSQLQGEIIPFGETEPYLYKMIGGNRFRVHASSFFQPNVHQAEKIFGTIREWAGLNGTENVYDLYTGVGTIALFLAPGAKQVTGIEGSAVAIEDAQNNARMNGIENVNFMTGDILETFKPDFLQRKGKADLIVLDPPRSGTLIEIKKTINTSGAKKVIYLSCNPVSLAFDLKQLTEVYRVTRIQPFDMLPHTHHLETLVMLEI